VSQQQRDAVDQLLRDAPLDLGGEVAEQRVIFEEMMAAIPVPADVTTSSGSLGGIPVVNVAAAGADRDWVIFYLHGGAYAIGTAASSVGLASDLARRAGARLVSVDYRLAPEHPHPAAIDDAVAAYRGLLDSGVSASAIAIAGESAGAGLAAATLVALKHAGLAQPSGAVLMSPWADVTLSGESIRGKAAVDPALTPEGLRRRAIDYVAAGDRRAELVSPIFADQARRPRRRRRCRRQARSHTGRPARVPRVRRDARRRRRRADRRRRVPTRAPRRSPSMRAWLASAGSCVEQTADGCHLRRATGCELPNAASALLAARSRCVVRAGEIFVDG
jgi:monoterpene epsilon-lactone hydrolase